MCWWYKVVEALRAGDPRRIGDFEIVGRLGSGGMGQVWLGQNASGTPVAIKTIHGNVVTDEGLARFRREARAALQVASPWTARVLTVDLDHDPPFLVTEFVPGATLPAYVEQTGPMQGRQVRAFAAALAEGVGSIHQAGVVHRDVSPNNIILSPDGPKIIDLGVAEIADATRLTRSGVALGTPVSMAPEQIRGRSATPATDVFSWGVAVVYAGTGRFPFGTGRAEAVAYRIVHDEPNLSGLDRDLAAIVGQALDKDPQCRPTARELTTQLVGEQQDATLAVTQLLKTVRLPGASSTIALPPAAITPAAPASGSSSDGTTLWRGHDGGASPERPQRRWLVASLVVTALVVVGTVLGVTVLANQNPKSPSDAQRSTVGSPKPADTQAGLPAVTVEPTASAPPSDLPLPTASSSPPNTVESYYSTTGGRPTRFPECQGLLGVCLDWPTERVVEWLGFEDSRFEDGEGGMYRTWIMPDLVLSMRLDGIGSVVSVSARPFESSTTVGLPSGHVLGLVRLDDVVRDEGRPDLVDTVAGEGTTIYSFVYYRGGEGSIEHRYSVSVDWDDDRAFLEDEDQIIAAFRNNLLSSFEVQY